MSSEFRRFSGSEPGAILESLKEVSSDASARLSSRIFLDSQNIAINNLPIGGEEGLDSILSFFPLAKEGYGLHLRSETVNKDEIPDILKTTLTENLQDMLGSEYSLKRRILGEQPSLSIYRHTLATLIALSEVRIVTAGNFENMVPGTSFWPYRPKHEEIWNLLGEIGEATRKMILDRKPLVREQSAFRATHFFAMGCKMADVCK